MDDKKFKFDFKKSTENITSGLKVAAEKAKDSVQAVAVKTAEMSKDAVANTSAKLQEMKEKAKDSDFQRRLERFNPLFSDELYAGDFVYPAMIVITEDGIYPDKEVCDGALGWRSRENDFIVLHLHRGVAENSNLHFVPSALRDTVYYVDRFDPNRYIQLDDIFNKAHEERLAELKMIAYSLGAKYFSVEISETSARAIAVTLFAPFFLKIFFIILPPLFLI